MKRIIIESPLSGDFARNIRYARLCCLDSLQRGEAPFASHLLYTQMLDDRIHGHRRLGMEAGFCWGEVGDLRVFYTDLGVSGGMAEAEVLAVKAGQPTERRTLPDELMNRLDDDIVATPDIDTKRPPII
jgi:hypothetical protein